MSKKKVKKAVSKKKIVKSPFQKYRWMMFGAIAGIAVSLFFMIV